MEEESTNYISVSNVAKLITIDVKRKLKLMMILTRKQLCNDSIWIPKNLAFIIRKLLMPVLFHQILSMLLLSLLMNINWKLTQNNFKYGKDSFVGQETFSSRNWGIKEAKRSSYWIRFHWIRDYTYMQIFQLPIQISNRFGLCPRKERSDDLITCDIWRF